MQGSESDLTFSRVIAVARRRGPIVLLCFVIALGASLAYSLSAQKKYTATASLLFNNSSLGQQIAGLQAVVNSNPQGTQDTNLELLRLGDVAEKTAKQVGHGLTAGTVAGSLGVSASGDTTIVHLSSTLPSAMLAAQVANTYARIFVQEQSSGDRAYYQAALRTIERQISQLTPAQRTGAQGIGLQTRAQSLGTLAQLRNDTVSLAQTAGVPSAASSPSIRRNAIVAAVLGLLAGIILALIIERLDQLIREPEDLERTYDLPLLGAVPQSASLRREKHTSAPPIAVTDTFQFVRARLRYFNVDRDLRVLAVVSAQPGDGKTTIAHWLAYASGAMGTRVLLIDTDLRRPTMADELNLTGGRGLADVLIGACSVSDAIQTVTIEASSGWSNNRSIDVIVAGGLPPNPAEMLESHAMSEVIEVARRSYDFVVLDTPPLGAVSDALPLMSRVDGVAIVASMRRNRRDSAKRLKETLQSVDAPLLGVIANRTKGRRGSDYGYGGYAYESNPDLPRLAPSRDAESESLDPADSIRLDPVADNGDDRSSTPADSGAGEAQSPTPDTGSPRQTGPDAETATLAAPGAKGEMARPVSESENGHRATGAPGMAPVYPATGVEASGVSDRAIGASRPSRSGPRSQFSDRIIIYRLGSIGDTVAALPCFHLIERAFPDAERVVLTNHPVSNKAAPLATVLEPGGFIHRTIAYPIGLRNPMQLTKLRRLLREEGARTLVYLAASRGVPAVMRDVSFFRMCGFRSIIGAPLKDLQDQLVDADGEIERESARLARNLRSLGPIDLADRSWWDLRLTGPEHAAAESALAQAGLRNQEFIVVNTGGKAAEKDWGAANWMTLLRLLRETRPGWGLAFIGGPEDRDRAALLAKEWTEPTVDLCGRLTPRESAAAIGRASLFIGHDSGALHLADAVGTPAVGLFGDYNKPAQWHPPGKTTRVIHNLSGLRSITPEDVLAVIADLVAVAQPR